MNISDNLYPLKNKNIDTIIAKIKNAKLICFENFSIFITNGVFESSESNTFSATFPNSVYCPVAITTPLPLPFVTILPANAILSLSANSVSLGNVISNLFFGFDYPNFDLMSKYREIEKYNKTCPKDKIMNLEEIIKDKIVSYADEYTIINDKRGHNLYWSRNFIIINFLITILNLIIITSVKIL